MPSSPCVSPADVVRGLAARGLTLSTAESLTGGALASAIVSVPGASEVYVGGVVAYATELKVSLLGVPQEVVDRDGVVSATCAEAMALGARARTGADVGVATTGVAGPDPQEGRPPGTVFVAVSGPDGSDVAVLALEGDRAAVRAATVDAALDLVLRGLATPTTPVGSGE